jgi:GNAT superfamily N-acetyltransferase
MKHMELCHTIYRRSLRESDPQAIREIVKSTGYFSDEEIEVAVELASEGLHRGNKSSYQFMFAEVSERLIAYTCFGRIPGTLYSYDLYWIVVHEDFRGLGIGRALLKQTEETISGLGGCYVYIETSSRSLYEPTRQFYVRCGYTQTAVLENFYAPGDSKITYRKVLKRGGHVQNTENLRLHCAREPESSCSGADDSSSPVPGPL